MDPANAVKHMTGSSIGSPWVSVTGNYSVAQDFANKLIPGIQDRPSGRVLRIETSRVGVPSYLGGTLSIREGEELLFWQLGQPWDHDLSIVE